MTTQEPTTGGLPGTTGGALPADRGPGGDAVPVELPRPGDRTTAAPAITVEDLLRRPLPGVPSWDSDEGRELRARVEPLVEFWDA